MHKALNTFAVVALAACGQTPSAGAPTPAPPEAVLPAAPWSGDMLARTAVPPAYLSTWDKAANRSTCALIAPAHVGTAGAGATPRVATFSGGWAVAYDLPETRSAFGVAGTAVKTGDPTYDDWPFRIRWADGSLAEYGPEGGSGPNQLAYLRISGQGCVYNVWSRLGRSHLEALLDALRFVR